MNASKLLALLLATSCAALPLAADAGGAAAAARAALARKAAAAAAIKSAERPLVAGKPRDVIIHRSQHPQAAAHIEHAQKNGQPSVLHIDRAGAAERRVAATGSVNPHRKPAPHYERDEYPPAFTREGGHNANVRFIDPHDNRGAGSTMGAQARGLADGEKIRVLVTD